MLDWEEGKNEVRGDAEREVAEKRAGQKKGRRGSCTSCNLTLTSEGREMLRQQSSSSLTVGAGSGHLVIGPEMVCGLCNLSIQSVSREKLAHDSESKLNK